MTRKGKEAEEIFHVGGTEAGRTVRAVVDTEKYPAVNFSVLLFSKGTLINADARRSPQIFSETFASLCQRLSAGICVDQRPV